MKTMIVLFSVIIFALSSMSTEARQPPAELNDDSNLVHIHGRLSISNGTPSCRIWIVGTKRILGLEDEDNEECPLPTRLSQALLEDINDRCVYADYSVLPVTAYKEGVMQVVKFVSAKNIVITTGDGRLIRRIDGIINRNDTGPNSASDQSKIESSPK